MEEYLLIPNDCFSHYQIVAIYGFYLHRLCRVVALHHTRLKLFSDPLGTVEIYKRQKLDNID
jgi:hypothetical protein